MKSVERRMQRTPWPRDIRVIEQNENESGQEKTIGEIPNIGITLNEIRQNFQASSQGSKEVVSPSRLAWDRRRAFGPVVGSLKGSRRSGYHRTSSSNLLDETSYVDECTRKQQR